MDPHTHGRPTHHKEKETPSPQYKQLGPTTFVSLGILLSTKLTPDINNWLYKDPPPNNQERLDYYRQKFPQEHKLVTEKWNYQGGGLGPEGRGMQCPLQPHIGQEKTTGLGFGKPTTEGTNRDGHAFSNIHRDLIEIKDIPEEVEK